MDRYGYGDGEPGNPSVGYVAGTQLKDIEKRLPLRVLSPADWKHWTTWGYVVVQNAVPQDNVRRLIELCGSSRRWTRMIRRPGTSRSCATTR